MSNQAITWAYRQPIISGAKFVLVALADLADEGHSCYPGQKKLAVMTGQSERTVRRQLVELERSGYITRRRRFDGAGHRTSDRYVLPVDSDVLIPTGQNDHRPDEPAAIHDSPTGQDDRVSLSEPPDSPQPPASGGRTMRHCDSHTKFRNGCDRCVRAAAADDARKARDERRRSDAVLAEIEEAKRNAVRRPGSPSQAATA